MFSNEVKISSEIFDSPLGKKIEYIDYYSPELLFAISRQTQRDKISISKPFIFTGYDIWNAYELSWLNPKGKPVVALGRFMIPCESPFIVESKSFKFYLNSFNQTRFSDKEEVLARILEDISQKVGMKISGSIVLLDELPVASLQQCSQQCLDNLDIEIDCYEVTPSLLSADPTVRVTESVCSNLLKSNCPVTGQPDWATIQITYKGAKINHEGLLRYIISFRDHDEFHEHCVERIYSDIMRHCQPEKLTIEAKYSRRGGLDINPFRTNEVGSFPKDMHFYR